MVVILRVASRLGLLYLIFSEIWLYLVVPFVIIQFRFKCGAFFLPANLFCTNTRLNQLFDFLPNILPSTLFFFFLISPLETVVRLPRKLEALPRGDDTLPLCDDVLPRWPFLSNAFALVLRSTFFVPPTLYVCPMSSCSNNGKCAPLTHRYSPSIRMMRIWPFSIILLSSSSPSGFKRSASCLYVSVSSCVSISCFWLSASISSAFASTFSFASIPSE
mmetsp:Transcript_13450/g.20148  ORF Transcript_13450/g.20148 Transcript_13450/m.20148 type:complete len:218 (-) Transcript_13450:1871-2524(-)